MKLFHPMSFFGKNRDQFGIPSIIPVTCCFIRGRFKALEIFINQWEFKGHMDGFIPLVLNVGTWGMG